MRLKSKKELHFLPENCFIHKNTGMWFTIRITSKESWDGNLEVHATEKLIPTDISFSVFWPSKIYILQKIEIDAFEIKLARL